MESASLLQSNWLQEMACIRLWWTDSARTQVLLTYLLTLSAILFDILCFSSQFVGRLRAEMGNRGMTFPDPTVVQCFPNANPLEMNDLINSLMPQNVEFVFVVHPDNDDHMHRNIYIIYHITYFIANFTSVLDMLKYTEAETRITTQAVKLRTVKSILSKGQPQTLQNIIHKTNVKVYCIQYTLYIHRIHYTNELESFKSFSSVV